MARPPNSCLGAECPQGQPDTAHGCGSNSPLHSSLFVVVQLLSCVRFFATLWTAAHQASLSFTIFRSLLKLMSFESVMPSKHLVLCRPLLLPPIFPSIRVFFNGSALCIRRPKYWSFSFSNSPSNEYSWLISFRIDCFDLLTVQQSQESSPTSQFKSISSSSGEHSSLVLTCFMVQLSDLYMTTGKTMVLTRQTFVSKEMSLILSTLFRFVTAFLPRIKHLLISWLQSPSAVIWEGNPPK